MEKTLSWHKCGENEAKSLENDTGVKVTNHTPVTLKGSYSQIKDAITIILNTRRANFISELRLRHEKEVNGEWEEFFGYDHSKGWGFLMDEGTQLPLEYCNKYDIVYYFPKHSNLCYIKGEKKDRDRFKMFLKYNYGLPSTKTQIPFDDAEKELIKVLKEYTSNESNDWQIKLKSSILKDSENVSEEKIKELITDKNLQPKYSREKFWAQIYCEKPKITFSFEVFLLPDRNQICFKNPDEKTLADFLKDDNNTHSSNSNDRDGDDISNISNISDISISSNKDGDNSSSSSDDSDRISNDKIIISPMNTNSVYFQGDNKSITTSLYAKKEKMKDMDQLISDHCKTLRGPFFDKFTINKEGKLSLPLKLPYGYFLIKLVKEKTSTYENDDISVSISEREDKWNAKLKKKSKCTVLAAINKNILKMLETNDWNPENVAKSYIKSYPSMESLLLHAKIMLET